MADEIYSVVFDMIGKGGRPLILNAPPTGAGAIGGASAFGARSKSSAGANAWAVVLGAALISGFGRGLVNLKRVKQPAPVLLKEVQLVRPAVRTEVFQGTTKLREALPYRETTPAQIATMRQGAIRSSMEATAMRERNKQLLAQNKEQTQVSNVKEMGLKVDNDILKKKVAEFEEREVRQRVNRVTAQQMRRQGDALKMGKEFPEYRTQEQLLRDTQMEVQTYGPLISKPSRSTTKGSEPGIGKSRKKEPDERTDRNYKLLKEAQLQTQTRDAATVGEY